MEMKNASPLDSKAVLKKIDKSMVRIAGKQQQQSKRKTQSKAERSTVEPKEQKRSKTEKVTFTDEQFIEALKKIGHAATSREISDALGIENPDFGRQLVRTRMEKLVEEGKVKITEAEKGRAARLYSLA
jgi:hypothetical protein